MEGIGERGVARAIAKAAPHGVYCNSPSFSLHPRAGFQTLVAGGTFVPFVTTYPSRDRIRMWVFVVNCWAATPWVQLRTPGEGGLGFPAVVWRKLMGVWRVSVRTAIA